VVGEVEGEEEGEAGIGEEDTEREDVEDTDSGIKEGDGDNGDDSEGEEEGNKCTI